MDIYSAKRRLSRPFVVDAATENAEFPIEARGMIGDGLSVALVRVDGVIDWLCWPRFDSPSVFGALLDPKNGGLTAISPVSRPFESDQIYDPDTNVLETLFTVPGQGERTSYAGAAVEMSERAATAMRVVFNVLFIVAPSGRFSGPRVLLLAAAAQAAASRGG